jgi:hypothetical protein
MAGEDCLRVFKGRLRGAGNIADKRPKQEGPQLVHDRAGGLSPGGVGQALVPLPETEQERVAHAGNETAPEFGVDEQRGNIGQVPGTCRCGSMSATWCRTTVMAYRWQTIERPGPGCWELASELVILGGATRT